MGNLLEIAGHVHAFVECHLVTVLEKIHRARQPNVN